jgi:hypothetical protein
VYLSISGTGSGESSANLWVDELPINKALPKNLGALVHGEFMASIQGFCSK